MNEVNAAGRESYAPVKSGAASSANTQGTPKTGKVLPPEGQQKPSSASETKAEGRDFRDSVRQAVAQMNEYVRSTQRDLQFSYDEQLGDTIVKVLDSETQKVIRQIPDEVFVELARELNADEPVPLLKAQA